MSMNKVNNNVKVPDNHNLLRIDLLHLILYLRSIINKNIKKVLEIMMN